MLGRPEGAVVEEAAAARVAPVEVGAHQGRRGLEERMGEEETEAEGLFTMDRRVVDPGRVDPCNTPKFWHFLKTKYCLQKRSPKRTFVKTSVKNMFHGC